MRLGSKIASEPNRETLASAGVKYGKPCAVKREREREKQAKHSTRLLVLI